MNALTEIKPITMSALARQALDDAGGIKAAAIADVENRLARDKVLRRSLVAEAVETAIKTSTNTETLRTRSRVAQAAQRSGLGQSAVHALASAMASSLLDYPMSDGTPLREAGRDQIAVTRDHAATRAKTLSHRARFLSAVHDLVPAQGVAGDVLDDGAAQEIWEKAQ